MSDKKRECLSLPFASLFIENNEDQKIYADFTKLIKRSILLSKNCKVPVSVNSLEPSVNFCWAKGMRTSFPPGGKIFAWTPGETSISRK